MTHAQAGSLVGNRITTNRWAKIFRKLGHQVAINNIQKFCHVFVAVHSQRCGPELLKFKSNNVSTPTILLLAGTDTYAESGFSKTAKKAIEAADFLVTLEPNAKKSLPEEWQRKTNVIPQSAQPAPNQARLKSCFEISVCGHLRSIKLPFDTARACLQLPDNSKVRVNHYGIALNNAMKNSAIRWMSKSPRYFWLGGKPHWRTRQMIARSRLHINSSKIESCANSVIESIVSGTPVLASRIPGNSGVLGNDYPGFFEPGSERQLAALIHRAECEKGFISLLKNCCAKIASNHRPAIEQQKWRNLFNQVK